jgi:hypothetical protein
LLIALGAGALVRSLPSFAQPQGAKVYRVGFLGIALASGYVRFSPARQTRRST